MSALEIGLELTKELLVPLATEIARAIEEGLDEQAATDRALERLRATPLPAPVLPRVRRLIAEARAKRSEEDTRETTVPR